MDKILDTINIYKPTLSRILLELWGLIKAQGLSFILIGAFGIYQIKINNEQSNKITGLQNELATYWKEDRIVLVKTIDKATTVLEKTSTALDNNNKILSKKK